ncbi:MAG: ribosome maturation factor RimP, partial [Bacteroidota bacterium]
IVVSSPGLDRPLKYQRQYRRHIGRPLSVRYTYQSMTRNVEGELQGVSDEWIVLKKSVEDPTRREDEALRIPFDSIAEAKVKLSW